MGVPAIILSHKKGVAYIHGNRTHREIDGGDFVFYPHGVSGKKVSFKARYNSGRSQAQFLITVSVHEITLTW